MVMWKRCDNVKGVARGDEPTENYHLNPESATFQHFSEFQLIVYLSGHNFTVLVLSPRSQSNVFSHSRQLFSEKRLQKRTVHCLLPAA